MRPFRLEHRDESPQRRRTKRETNEDQGQGYEPRREAEGRHEQKDGRCENTVRLTFWLVLMDAVAVGDLAGLDGAALHGGIADIKVAAWWLDDGLALDWASGRAFTTGSVHGVDLAFAAPKSVPLLRALTDDMGDKATVMALQKCIDAAMAYLHQRAGSTRCIIFFRAELHTFANFYLEDSDDLAALLGKQYGL